MQRRNWPEWLETLRPDEITRQRVRGRIMQQVEPLLAARRRIGWDEVASRWAMLLLPAAAIVTLVFGGLAVRAGPRSEAPQIGSADVVADSLSDLGLVLSHAVEVQSP